MRDSAGGVFLYLTKFKSAVSASSIAACCLAIRITPSLLTRFRYSSEDLSYLTVNQVIILDKTTFSAFPLRVAVGIASTAGASFSNNSDFEITSSAGTSTATIVYDPVSGQLFYNQNGSAAGFGSGGLFATLTGAPTLMALNFVVQA